MLVASRDARTSDSPTSVALTAALLFFALLSFGLLRFGFVGSALLPPLIGLGSPLLAELQPRIAGNTRVVLLHGLNESPAHLSQLAAIFERRGLPTTTVTLSGHASAAACGRTITDPAATWESETQAALRKVREPNIILVGYSVGALLALHAAEVHAPEADTVLAGLILFAPPVALQPKAWLLRPLLPLRYFNLALPSLAPKASRVCDSTPLGHYHAVFTLKEKVAHLDAPWIPMLLFADRDDELVSFQGIRRWLSRNQRTEARLVEVRATNESAPDLPAHLIVDPARVGTTQWRQMEAEINGFLADLPH